MEDGSSTHPYVDHLHHHHHHPSALHLNLHSHPQSPKPGYPSPQHPRDVPEQYGRRRRPSATSMPALSPFSGGGGEGGWGGDGGGFTNMGFEGDACLGGHFDMESGLGGNFNDGWYGNDQKDEAWDDRDSCESTAEDFYRKDDCYSNGDDVLNAGERSSENRGDCVDSFARGNTSYSSGANLSCEAKHETVYNRDANDSRYAKMNALYNRGGTYSISDGRVDDSRIHSRMDEGYLRGEDDFGSGRSSGEDQPPQAELKPGTWVSPSSTNQATEPGDGRPRGGVDAQAWASMYQPHTPPTGDGSGAHTQKLDSFSEAFFSHRKRGFPSVPVEGSVGRLRNLWMGREGTGLVRLSHGCVYDSLTQDSDSHLPPSSSPPHHLSLPSLPSPTPPSHLMSSVLSPPPTPLPPPSLSPPKMDSSSVFGAVGHPALKGPEPLGSVQFFPSQLQPLPTLHPSGVILKFLPHSHWLQQQSGDTRDLAESNPGSSHSYGQEMGLKARQGNLHGNSTAHSGPRTPDVSFLPSSSLHPSLRRSSPVHPDLPPSPRPHPFHQPPPPPHPPPHQTTSHFEPGDRAPPYMVSQEVQNGPLTQTCPKNAAPPIYTGTPFPSMLHSARGQRGGRYTPRPTLNPLRRGSGLYSSLSSVLHRERGMGRGGEEGGVLIPCINVGPDFQAELPRCFPEWEGSGAWPPEEESPREQLLWKPWEELEESAVLQGQVERLFSVCSSSCIPGGGSNTELALHCLHSCHGDTLATLEVLLFSPSSPAGDYHYSGSDVWTDSEKGLFSKALAAHGKDFSLVHKTVRTKSVRQCVEFYYVWKKLQDKQRKQREEEERERHGGVEQQARVVPVPRTINRQFGLEGAVPIPSLASFFPCKLCGKMFYKIKSRNAHMKIHRQPQEDWSERRLQHHLLTQRLALGLPHNLTTNLAGGLLQPQASALAYPCSGQLSAQSNNSHNAISVTNGNSVAHVNIPNHNLINNSDSNESGPHQRGPVSIVPLHQSWSPFGLNSDPATFYCNPEVKDNLGITAGSKGPIVWQ